ncbi:MAG: hypothetical protein U0T75_13395 [Chitinophagales bacterium]
MLSDTHLHFIHLVSGGMSYKRAYINAIAKGANPNTAKKKGSVLAKQYKKQIDEARRQRQQLVQQARNSLIVQKVQEQELTISELNAVLADIIRAGRDLQAEYPGKPTVFETLRALHMYYQRLDGPKPTVLVQKEFHIVPPSPHYLQLKPED